MCSFAGVLSHKHTGTHSRTHTHIHCIITFRLMTGCYEPILFSFIPVDHFYYIVWNGCWLFSKLSIPRYLCSSDESAVLDDEICNTRRVCVCVNIDFWVDGDFNNHYFVRWFVLISHDVRDNDDDDNGNEMRSKRRKYVQNHHRIFDVTLLGDTSNKISRRFSFFPFFSLFLDMPDICLCVSIVEILTLQFL